MHLRSETSRSGVRWTIDEDRWIEPRIELGEEQLAPLGLICLIDLVGASSETGETAQEAPIGRIGPADVSRSAPTIGTQRVESTVISHPVRGIAAHGVGRHVTGRRPREERTWMTGDDHTHCGATLSVIGDPERGLQSVVDRGILGRKDRRRNSRRQSDGVLSIGHDRKPRPWAFPRGS